MAFPTLQTADTQGGTQASNSTSWTGTYPTNLASGDLIVLVVGADGGGTASATGFTGNNVTEGSVALSYLAKVSDGTETGTFTITISASEQGCWRTFRITGWFGTLATGVSASTAGNWAGATAPPEANGSGTGPDPGDLDPFAWGTEDTLWLAMAASDHGNTTYTGFPTDFTNTSAQESGGAGGAGLGTAWRELNAASIDPGAFTTDASEGWAAGTVAIRPAAAGGVSVTPGTASLTTARFTPTVLTPRLVTPGLATLTTTRFAPAVTVGVRVIPGVGTVTLTPFAPTVTASQHQLVTPGTASLTLSPFAPTVATPVVVTPGLATLTTTRFAPTVTVGAGIVLTPGTATLTTTPFAPTVLTPRMVTPGTASLSTTTFAPAVLTPRLVTPQTASLTLTAFAPTVTAAGTPLPPGMILSLPGTEGW